MRKYLTISELVKEFPNIRKDDQLTDDDINTALQLGSSEVETLIGRYVEKQILAGTYVIGTDEVLIVAANSAQDTPENKMKLAAIKEGIAILAKFAIDTGYDFITGSQSMSMGAQNFSETMDFETSYARVKTRVKELLANYDFDNLLVASGSIVVQDVDAASAINDIPTPLDDETPLTEVGLLSRLTDTAYIEGVNGISWVLKDDTNPKKGVYIRLDENKLNEYIAKNLSSLRSFRGEYTVVNKNDISTNYNDILNGQVQNPQVGDIALLKLVLPAEPIYNGIIETYSYLSGRWEKTTANFEVAKALESIFDLAEGLDAKLIVQDAKLDALVSKVNTNTSDIISLRNALDVINRTITEHGTKLVSLENTLTPLPARIDALEAKDLAHETRLTNVEAQASNAEQTANDYAANKADFVRVSDITSSIVKTLPNLILNESGTDVKIALTADQVAGLTDGKNVRIKLIRTNVSPNRINYIEDDFAGTTITQNTLALEGTSYNCGVQILKNVDGTGTVLISGLAQAQRTVLTQNYKAVQLEQTSATAGASIDTQARQDAATALALATTANTTANQALTKVNAIDLTPITTRLGNIEAAATTLTATVNAIKTQIGTETLTTTAQTIIAAINEIRAAYKAADTTLHTTITQEVADAYVAKSKIKYYAGQIAIFNTEKVAPSKFADTTLFDKVVSKILKQNLSLNNVVLSNLKQVGGAPDNTVRTRSTDNDLVAGSQIINSLKVSLDLTPYTDTEYKYIAKKDITFAEMGE